MKTLKYFFAASVLVASAWAKEAFDAESDGTTWREATVEVRRAYCDQAAEKAQATKPGVTGKFIFDLLEQFYSKDISEVRKKKLFEMTAMTIAAYG